MWISVEWGEGLYSVWPVLIQTSSGDALEKDNVDTDMMTTGPGHWSTNQRLVKFLSTNQMRVFTWSWRKNEYLRSLSLVVNITADDEEARVILVTGSVQQRLPIRDQYYIVSTNQRSVLYCVNQSEARTHLDVEWESFDSVEWFPGQEVTLKSQSKISIIFVSLNHEGVCTWLDAVVPRLYQVSLIQTSASSHSTVTWWGPISCKSNVTKCIQSNNWFTLSLHKSRDISSYSSSVGSFTAWSLLHCLLPATLQNFQNNFNQCIVLKFENNFYLLK